MLNLRFLLTSLRCLLGASSIAAVLPTAPLGTQVRSNPEAAAVAAFRSELNGTKVIDPRALLQRGRPGEFGEARDETTTRSIAEDLGASVAELDNVRSCVANDLRRVCRLVDVDAFIGVSVPEVAGSNAMVKVLILTPSPSGSDQPISAALWRVELRQRGGGWVAEKRRVIAMT